MGQIKLTKNELRGQQVKLAQLERYLPTLQLKKALLQAEVHEARLELTRLDDMLEIEKERIGEYASVFATRFSINIFDYVSATEIRRDYENIAGCDVPIFKGISFKALDYDLFDTPTWLEGAIYGLRKLSEIDAHITVLHEKKKALESELRDVSIRVNLFEKVLIPECQKNIKTIKVFLGDQQLAAVAQAKVAKTKIERQMQTHEIKAHAY